MVTRLISSVVCRSRYELKGETIPATSGMHITVREPYGVVGRIIPFNHPIGFAASRLAPALVAGNSILIKPPEQARVASSQRCVRNTSCRLSQYPDW